jgi:hemolysin III
MEKPNPIEGKFGFHEIWHIFVIFGAVSHYLVMLIYVL